MIPSQTIRVKAPVPLWDDGIPLGNGLTGAMLYGEGSRIVLGLDRIDLWDERPSPHVLDTRFNYPHWVELKESGKWDELNRVFGGGRHLTPTKLPGGRLELTLADSQSASAFVLDMMNAVGQVKAGRNQTLIKCFDSATDGVIMLRLNAAASHGWKLMTPAGWRTPELGFPPSESGRSDDTQWFIQQVPQGMTYAVVATMRRIAGGAEIALAMTATTTDGTDPLVAGRQRVHDALNAGYEAMLARHRAWWQTFWSVSMVRVPDAVQQRQYNLARYLLGAGARSGVPALPLQGVWSNDDQLPPFYGDYHGNLETQGNYASYLASGHFEQGRAFMEFMWERLPVWRKFAREFYQTPGAMFPSFMSQGGLPTDTGWPAYALMPQGNGAWVGWMFYRHWLFTRDESFLRERAYPFCLELAECIASLLKPDAQGFLKTPISSSPEINDNTPPCYTPPNSNYDQASMLAFFGGLAHMAEVLDRTPDATRWRGIVTGLGGLWVNEKTHTLGFAPGMPFNVSHRHHAQLMALYPFDLLTVEGSDADRRLIKASLKELDKYGSDQWCGISYPWTASLKARTGDGNAALRNMRVFCREYTTRSGLNTQSNTKGKPGFQHPRCFCLEANMLAMDSIHEMLLQRLGGVIRVFPAIPARWADVEFRDLHTEGAFVVSATRENGKTRRISITSLAGQPCRIRLDTPDALRLRVDGRSTTLSPNAQGIYDLPLARDQEAILEDETAASTE